MPLDALYLPCGATAYFDEESGCSYRCVHCFATVGSIGQPARCKQLELEYANWKHLGGAGWDYDTGQPELLDPPDTK